MGFEAGDRNLYRFVSNQPTVATDPSGLVAVSALVPVVQRLNKPARTFTIPPEIYRELDKMWADTNATVKPKDKGPGGPREQGASLIIMKGGELDIRRSPPGDEDSIEISKFPKPKAGEVAFGTLHTHPNDNSAPSAADLTMFVSSHSASIMYVRSEDHIYVVMRALKNKTLTPLSAEDAADEIKKLERTGDELLLQVTITNIYDKAFRSSRDKKNEMSIATVAGTQAVAAEYGLVFYRADRPEKGKPIATVAQLLYPKESGK